MIYFLIKKKEAKTKKKIEAKFNVKKMFLFCAFLSEGYLLFGSKNKYLPEKKNYPLVIIFVANNS